MKQHEMRKVHYEELAKEEAKELAYQKEQSDSIEKKKEPKPEVVVVSDENKCKKCGNENMDELKSAKKSKGMFCMDVAACKARVASK